MKSAAVWVAVLVLTTALAKPARASDYPVVPKLAPISQLDGGLTEVSWRNALALKLEKQPDFREEIIRPKHSLFTERTNLSAYKFKSGSAPVVSAAQRPFDRRISRKLSHVVRFRSYPGPRLADPSYFRAISSQYHRNNVSGLTIQPNFCNVFRPTALAFAARFRR